MFEWLVAILVFFIGASLVLYIVLGGADYGAGILELLPSGGLADKQKKIVNMAMGPVWEANHMWLIIVVVILFMGFPLAFNTMMVSLHLPMVALLVGIVVRGCVFTFRHYDAIQEPRSQRFYTWTFGLSSLWTSMWLGIIAASLFRERINTKSVDFHEAYVAPWWGLYPFTVGVFVTCIFAFLASAYLIGETKDLELKRLFARRASVFNVLVLFVGTGVFMAARRDGDDLARDFVSDPVSLACMVGAILLFGLLWFRIETRHSWLTRLVAASQAGLILFGWFVVQAPNVLETTDGPMSFQEAAAPAATLIQLNLALLIGSLLIFPSLFYLIKVFKAK
ncbi:MAG: cytochrome d ubiquinol oxidase subunit II [Bdellovibrionaceae bacterium]|nr:cytochrome d ubiquinol oxidase subunit II [Pseudobdellovibrionaceae bacterium]MBX3033978.1 cytochrome d ubiquinol oxidase subunit II [Pseudobdellovibrionaceae bacterium]